MNIAYFPFTQVPERGAATAYRHFGRFALYTPVKGQEPQSVRFLAEKEWINRRCPILGDEALVINLCRSFRKWGAVHQGSAGGLKQFAESGFYNDQFAAEIRSEIIKFGGDVSQQKPNPVLNARVFLQLAQEFDQQEFEIKRQLAAADTATKQLFDELRGEGLDTDQNAGTVAGVADDAGAFMAEARMTAWSLLAGMDEIALDAFLTHSRAILDLLSDRFPAMVHVGAVKAVSGSETDDTNISDSIRRLARTPWEGRETMQREFGFMENSAAETDIYLIPDLPPAAVIRSFSDQPSGSAPAATDVRHSIVCLVSSR